MSREDWAQSIKYIPMESVAKELSRISLVMFVSYCTNIILHNVSVILQFDSVKR